MNISKSMKKENCNVTDSFDNFDIFHIDEKIKKLICQEYNKLNNYKSELINYEEFFNENYNKISDKKKKELKFKINMLIQKINDIENDILMAEYICVSTPVLEKYKKLIYTPVKVSFFNNSNIKNINDYEKNEIIEEFYEIAKKYIPIKIYKKETPERYICNCGNQSNYTETQNKIICNECSNVHSVQSIQTSFKDIDRVNLSQKYKYKKKVHFRDTVNQYQGKQNKKINSEIFSILEQQFLIHNLVNLEGKSHHEKYSNITKEHIYMFLFETNNSNYYEDINMIHTYFTGIPCPDISDIEHLLYEDFDKVVDAYESLENIDRIHFLNGQYILYQLLRRRKIKVKESDFDILKTRERLVEHDDIYQKICTKLEWTFIPTV